MRKMEIKKEKQCNLNWGKAGMGLTYKWQIRNLFVSLSLTGSVMLVP